MIMIGSVRQLGGYMYQHFDAHHDIVKIGELKGNKASNYEPVLLVRITPHDGSKTWCVFFTLTFDYHGGVSGIDGIAGYGDEIAVPYGGGRYCGHLSAETSYRPCYFFDPQKLDDYMRGIFGSLYSLDMVAD